MQYWFDQAVVLAQSVPLEVVVPSTLCLIFAKKIIKLTVGILKFGTLAALAVLMFSYVSKTKNFDSQIKVLENYSGYTQTAKLEVGERLIEIGERLKAIE